MIKEFNRIKPEIHKTAYIIESAEVIGNVVIGKNVSIWPKAVLRGDVDKIVIGEDTNIQDCSVLHTSKGFPTILGKGVVVGHGAVLHGTKIGNNCLIGMGAILLDGSVIGDNCIIGAGAVVSEGTKIPKGHLALGLPARVIRKLTKKEIDKIKKGAKNYLEYVKLHKKSCDCLT